MINTIFIIQCTLSTCTLSVYEITSIRIEAVELLKNSEAYSHLRIYIYDGKKFKSKIISFKLDEIYDSVRIFFYIFSEWKLESPVISEKS